MVFGGKVLSEKKLVALALICVVLSVGVIGAIMVLNQKNIEIVMKNDQIAGLENDKLALESQALNIRAEKLSLETQIANFQSEATSLLNDVTALGAQVSSLQTEAVALENEKSLLETQVSILQANVSSLQSVIVSLESRTQSLETQISSFRTDIAALETEVTASFNIGYSDGYDDGYLQGIEDSTTDGWYLSDPTYAEAIYFVNADTTDENDYSETYTCYSFTADFKGNALEMGYRCGFAYIEFYGSAHAIVCFDTTDGGLIYIEPQTDEIVTLTVGQIYDNQASWGLITFFGIIW